MSTETPPVKVEKFSHKQWEQMRPFLTEAQIADFISKGMVPTKSGPPEGTGLNERLEWFKEAVGVRGEGETEKSVSITKLMDMGFPKSVAATAYWSGISDGSMLAWSCGWVSSMEIERVQDSKTKKDTDHFKITLKLRAPTQQDITDRRESWDKKESKKKREMFRKPFPMPGEAAEEEEEETPEEK